MDNEKFSEVELYDELFPALLVETKLGWVWVDDETIKLVKEGLISDNILKKEDINILESELNILK